jgi:predicted amidophosphoribosyltransferase
MLNGRHQTSRLRNHLKDAFERYAKVGDDPEVQADFARYLCVLTSGYVEQSVRILFLELSRKRTEKRVFRYVASNLDRFHNPTGEKIASLVGAFDPELKADFERFINGERKDALNSVMAIRHKIAHGESVGTTYGQLRSHRESLYEIVDWLVDRLAGSS